MLDTPRRRETLPRASTLRRRSDFEQVKSRGKRTVGSGLVLNWICGPDIGRKFAVIAPKAIGGAVVRNLIKRRVRELYRRLQSSLPENLWSIWILRKGVDDKTYLELGEEMNKLYRKARLLDQERLNE